MALSREQRSVISRALGVARRLGASPREAKALIEALGVESGYRDLPYGDRDSVGALQQRPSQGWGPASESLETDVAQFLRRARKANTGRGSAGQLAQTVQRSAFPGRYDERSAEANALLRGSDLGGGRNVSGSVRVPTPGFVETSFPEPNVAPLAQLLSQQLAQQQQQRTPETTPLPLPAMAAGPPMPNVPLPQGARIIQSAQPAVQQPRVSPLDLLPKTDAQLPEVSVTSGRPGSVSTTGPSAGRAGQVAPGGSFGGTTKPVIEIAKLGHSYGLKTTSGKRDTLHTSTGGVSDHYRGKRNANARDLSGSVDDMDRAAVAITRALGIKDYKRGQALERTVRRNGLRYQLLYRTNTGGNHFDHIHVGVAR